MDLKAQISLNNAQRQLITTTSNSNNGQLRSINQQALLMQNHTAAVVIKTGQRMAYFCALK